MTPGSKQVWIDAGALMIGSVLLGPLLQVGSYLGPTGSLLSTLLIVVSMIMFAIGSERSTSVTARRPLGTAALIGLAVWTAVGTPALDALAAQPGHGSMIGYGHVDLIVSFVLAAIATTQIARAGIVPRPWHLAPLWVLVAATAVRVVQLLVVVAVRAVPLDTRRTRRGRRPGVPRDRRDHAREPGRGRCGGPQGAGVVGCRESTSGDVTCIDALPLEWLH